MYFSELNIGDKFVIKGSSITAIKTGPSIRFNHMYTKTIDQQPSNAVNVDNGHHLTLGYYAQVYKVKPTVKYNCPDCGLKVDDCTGCPRCKDVK